MLGADGVISRATELKVYECDGWSRAQRAGDTGAPAFDSRDMRDPEIALPSRHRLCAAWRGHRISGGCLALNAPVMICTSRMNRIISIDIANRAVEVSPASSILMSPTRSRPTASSTHPIRRRRSPALSAETSPKIPADRIRSNTA